MLLAQWVMSSRISEARTSGLGERRVKVASGIESTGGEVFPRIAFMDRTSRLPLQVQSTLPTTRAIVVVSLIDLVQLARRPETSGV